MSNHERSLTTSDSALLNQIVSQVCQTIITIQQQQPELLMEKYRKVQWQKTANQSALSAKFTELLSQTRSREELINKLQLYLKAFLVPAALNVPIISELIAEIRNHNPVISDLNSCLNSTLFPALVPVGIGVLLLDAENLQLNINTEKFLGTICQCPIQVKIAFANWSNRGKLDVELHERGYDLIHVPAGRDNADGKMIAFGSSIHELYPKAKEVFVCSSDKVMTNLCNNLQQHGLTVYQVSQHGENINIFNNATGETIINSIKPLPEIPSIDQFVLQVKHLIKEEQKQTANYWIKLSQISKLYKTKYQINISNVIAKYLPGKRARDIFISYPADFVIHQVDDVGELYITLFEQQHFFQKEDINPAENNKNSQVKNNLLANSLTTKLDLEKAIKNIWSELSKESKNESFDITILASKFKQKYGKPITEQMKELQIGGTFAKFLQSCSDFQVQLKDNKWQVIKLNSPSSGSVLSSVSSTKINSAADLEKALKMILTELTKTANNNYVDIGILGIKFHQQYGKPITKQMKELQINGSFIKFLQSCNSFQIQQKGNKYKIVPSATMTSG
ncbi:NYN domain-containing protein [Anabaena aphanizomenioides LEGE 00250]|uniref:NYN domain-containing protein n=1 Tax=Sphaerospermopsis aphanizomenoides LEGE 00250 TaxID=2777972 RepID=A0ABR9VJ57_9CYAN|nr:NYN domain-containing protein [Sphaerospermopsis aphanizomenoides]MBE9238516.1 NYN domain-containing protein [Sphaerospermopsis aphanizomenoides LEGE 00250]